MSKGKDEAFENAYASVVENGWTNVKHMARQVWDMTSATPPAAQVQGEREAFEAWQSSAGWKRPDDPGEWEAWQARAALSAPPAAGVPEGLADALLREVQARNEVLEALFNEFCRGGTPNWDHLFERARQLFVYAMPEPAHSFAAGKSAPTPPASEQKQAVQQPHTVEFVGKTCQRVLMAEGKPYPRTCAVCGLSGPCKSFPRESDLRLNPHLAKGEGV